MAYDKRIDPRDFFEDFISGGRLVKSYEDPLTDRTVCLVEVAIDGHNMRRAAMRPELLVRTIVGQVENATRAVRYLARPRPRLSAGTVGYARRRR